MCYIFGLWLLAVAGELDSSWVAPAAAQSLAARGLSGEIAWNMWKTSSSPELRLDAANAACEDVLSRGSLREISFCLEMADFFHQAVAHYYAGSHDEAIAAYSRAGAPGNTLFDGAIAPMACAAAAWESIGAEATERVLNKITPEWRVTRAVASPLASLRKLINRISIVVPATPTPFDSRGQRAMLGGSEEAVVFLSRALAVMGRNVRVFCPLPIVTSPGLDEHGVDWQDFTSFRPDDEHGGLVVWRHSKLIPYIATRRQAPVGAASTLGSISFVSLWMHDASVGVGLPHENAAALQLVDSVVALSEFHRGMIVADCSSDPGNIISLSNGIVAEEFADDVGKWQKRPHSAVYSSSPSRGLIHLLSMWPHVRAQVPGATLDIYYDWSSFARESPSFYTTLLAAYDDVRDLGVTYHGGVGHAELHDALKRASVWAYTHFEETKVETFCISAVKAAAAGCTVLTTPHGALPEVVPDASMHLSPDSYRDQLISLLTSGEDMGKRVARARAAIDHFDWSAVAAEFSRVWSPPVDSPPYLPDTTCDRSDTTSACVAATT